MKVSTFDHKLFVQKVVSITGCTHDQAFEVLGLVVEHTQRAWMQGVNHSYDNKEIAAHTNSLGVGDGCREIQEEL